MATFHDFRTLSRKARNRSVRGRAILAWAGLGGVALAAAMVLARGPERQVAPEPNAPVMALDIFTPMEAAATAAPPERDFIDRFAQEKRDARIEELPAQF